MYLLSSTSPVSKSVSGKAGATFDVVADAAVVNVASKPENQAFKNDMSFPSQDLGWPGVDEYF